MSAPKTDTDTDESIQRRRFTIEHVVAQRNRYPANAADQRHYDEHVGTHLSKKA
jgi:hypothetical protein